MELARPFLSAVAIHALGRALTRPIALVGMMGVGKSTIGRRLAAMLGIPFIDADEEIAAAAQLSIPEIFAAFGEEGFRDGERRVIARIIDEDRDRVRVIATGGGAFCHPATRALLLERTITVWIDAETDVLVERVVRKNTRPMLRDGDPAEILDRLRREREPFYAEAAIHVTSGKGPHARTAIQIAQEIAQCL